MAILVQCVCVCVCVCACARTCIVLWSVGVIVHHLLLSRTLTPFFLPLPQVRNVRTHDMALMFGALLKNLHDKPVEAKME